MNQNQTKTSATTTDIDKHPSGLTWERWYWPWKMPEERKMIQEWLKQKAGQDLNDGSTPF